MSISPRFLDELRSRLTLSEMIGKRIKITRAGREYKACCPFHHEKSPSFTINDDKQFYHCFGCGAHGDVIKFTMEHDGLGFMEALELLCSEAGMQMPKPDPKAAQKAEKEKDLYACMDMAASWFQEQMLQPQNLEILSYIDKRGVDEKARELFRIGYAPSDGQALRKYLNDQGYEDKELIQLGLLKASSRGGQPYTFFRDRVMFPVMDRRGRVVAFGGRILPDHMRPKDRGDFTPPKYINTSDTPLFDKGRMLYGEHLARNAARDGHTLVVTEGYMDVIACHSAGFKGAVAPMGTALTDNQIASLWSMQVDDQKQPVLCFDGDNAGRRAAGRACENLLPLLKAGKSARFAFLPEGEDPDSLLKSGGREALQNILRSALSLFDFLWLSHTAGRKFDTPEARAGLDKSIMADVARISDGEVQRHYRELVKTQISESFFRNRYQNLQKAGASSSQGGARNNSSSQKYKPKPKRPVPRSPLAQRDIVGAKILLAAVINNPSLYEEVDDALGRIVIPHYTYDMLRQNLVTILSDEHEISALDLKKMLLERGFDEEMGDILNESVYVHAAFSRPEAMENIERSECVSKWRSIYEALQDTLLNQEIKQGWKQAILESDETKEGVLKDMVQDKKSGSV